MANGKNAGEGMREHSSTLIVGLLLGAFFASGLWLFYINTHETPAIRPLRESDIASSTGYTLTDPLIGLTSSGNTTGPDYIQLQQQLAAYISAQKSDGLSSASVKFADTLQSEGLTINADEVYDPASLTKVPLMMAYYDLAQQQPSVLSDMILYSGDEDLDASEQIKSAVQLIPGHTYSVEEMIEHMIKYSDNNAEQLLANHLAVIGQLSVLNALFSNLGIKINPKAPDYITVQSYMLLMRVLFNATYLDRDYSEKALQLLSQTDFTAGLSAGVPSSIVIAQKFGDARIPDMQGNIVGAELQNCGIIYYPDHPYQLCIMTKGSNVSELERVISGISKMVFQTVQERYASDMVN